VLFAQIFVWGLLASFTENLKSSVALRKYTSFAGYALNNIFLSHKLNFIVISMFCCCLEAVSDFFRTF